MFIAVAVCAPERISHWPYTNTPFTLIPSLTFLPHRPSLIMASAIKYTRQQLLHLGNNCFIAPAAAETINEILRSIKPRKRGSRGGNCLKHTTPLHTQQLTNTNTHPHTTTTPLHTPHTHTFSSCLKQLHTANISPPPSHFTTHTHIPLPKTPPPYTYTHKHFHPPPET